MEEVATLDQAGKAGVVVLVNPNNPDGRTLGRDTLLAFAEDLRRRGGWLVVDEAFADFDADETLVPAMPENAIVLRSFGKTYGLAGVRLGFALAGGETATRLKAMLGPWAVSGPAIAVGLPALRDREWRQAAGEARMGDAHRLDRLLAPVSDETPQGTSLYRLMKSSRAPELFAHLGRSGIWVRRFQYDPRLLRFGLPGSEASWQRLANALTAFDEV